MKGTTVTDKDADTAEDGRADACANDGQPEVEVTERAELPSRSRRQISLSLRTLVAGALVLVLAAALGVMTWLYLGERAALRAQLTAVENDRHSEQIAMDYAVGAAAMNFQDLNTWKGKLVEGTSPELREKLDKAADSMQQLLIPLEWNSTSEPLVAKVRSSDGGVYVVDTFVSVLTKTTQAPESLQSTATYSITIDSNNDWLITDVGGIGAVAGAK